MNLLLNILKIKSTNHKKKTKSLPFFIFYPSPPPPPPAVRLRRTLPIGTKISPFYKSVSVFTPLANPTRTSFPRLPWGLMHPGKLFVSAKMRKIQQNLAKTEKNAYFH